MDIHSITQNNLLKLSAFLQLLEDQMNIDGYGRTLLRPQFICLSIEAMKNRGIVADEIRLMAKLINKIKSEKVINIINDQLIEGLRKQDREDRFSNLGDSTTDNYRKQRYAEQKEKKINGWLRSTGRFSDINREDFDKKIVIDILHKEKFKELKEKYLIADTQIHKKSETKSNLKILHLNSSGDLWREPKNQYCYSINKTSNRYKIVKTLVLGKKYYQANELSEVLIGQKPQTIRTEVGKINKKIKSLLVIKDNLIIGKPGSGYKINPLYKVTLRNKN